MVYEVYDKIKNTTKKLRFYYRENGVNYVMETEKDKNMITETEKERINNKLNNNYNYFELFEGYEGNEEGLRKYIKDFMKITKTLMKSNIFKIKYDKYYDHKNAVLNTFMRLTDLKIYKNEFEDKKIEDLDYLEFYNSEMCNNGGLIYINKEILNKKIECYGNDYVGFYPYLLGGSDLKISIKKPEYKKLDKLKFKNLKYGIYLVEIKCSNPKFYRKFSFSKDNRYTHYCLKYAYSQRKKYDIHFNLIQTENYNAIIYEEDSLIDSKLIFKKWYETMKSLKQENKNMLIKHLSSSLWGYLCENDKIYMNEEEINEIDDNEISDKDEKKDTKYKIIKERLSYDNNDNVKINFTLVNKDKPYKFNIARLKPFLMSYSRCYVAEMIDRENIEENIIRVQTDGIVLNKKHEFNNCVYNPIEEEKTTGLINWKNVNSYYKYCNNCDCYFHPKTLKIEEKNKIHNCEIKNKKVEFYI